MTTSPGTSILRDKLNIVVYTSGLCAWPKLLTDHGLIFLEQGKKGSTDCQPLEDQPWAPRTLLLAPPLFIHSSLISFQSACNYSVFPSILWEKETKILMKTGFIIATLLKPSVLLNCNRKGLGATETTQRLQEGLSV